MEANHSLSIEAIQQKNVSGEGLFKRTSHPLVSDYVHSRYIKKICTEYVHMYTLCTYRVPVEIPLFPVESMYIICTSPFIKYRITRRGLFFPELSIYYQYVYTCLYVHTQIIKSISKKRLLEEKDGTRTPLLNS